MTTRGETKVQFNMRLPKAHVERLNQLREAAGGMTQAEFVSRLIDEEWARRENEMNALSNRIAIRQTRKGDWLVYEKVHGWKTGQQFGRFDEQDEAEQYAVELRADLRRKEQEIEAMINQPRPTVTKPIDPYNHPAFWTIEADDAGKDVRFRAHSDFFDRVMQECGEETRLAIGKIEEIVPPGYGTPYRFGQYLRDLVEDNNATIFRHNNSGIYIAIAVNEKTSRAAFYDPSKRSADEALFNGDWYSAVDELMQGVGMNRKPVFVSHRKPHADMDGAEFDLVIVNDEHGFTIIQRDYENGRVWNETPVSSHPTLDEAETKAAEYLAQV